MQTWHDVSRHTPCSICGKPNWCRVSTDGAWAICRRVDSGGGIRKQDKGGSEYWLYRFAMVCCSAAGRRDAHTVESRVC